MKFTLKDYQVDAVNDVLINLKKARKRWHDDGDRNAFSLTAITGAGKTVMAAAVFEALFHGDDEYNFDPDPSAVVIWFSDDPSLNEQTRFRLMEASDRIQHTDLVVVENTFNRAKFEAGKIYFLNTQKLGKNSLLVRGHDPDEIKAKAGELLPETRPDLRSFTIWDTIRNTIEDSELTLYLVLDEAHRGMGNPSESVLNIKSTIVLRLINGAFGVPGAPIVWGISATVERFQKAMEGALQRDTLQPVVVQSQKVQESGLIKDMIILDMPDDVGDFDTVLVRRATDKLRASTEAWLEYANEQQDAKVVIPLMVLQVPNTPDPNEIGRALDTIHHQYPDLPNGCIAHVLGDHTTQQFGNRFIPYIEPERVQDSTWVRVLIAKDAISTGWDCPRAEVMISFRSANDRTHITQLLGRMVRSPLARRIIGHDRLNAVDCLLPKFNIQTVNEVVDSLMNGGDFAQIVPGRILINPSEMKPNTEVTEAFWEKFESLPSQTRPQRGAKPAKRLTALAHELASDGILPGAGQKAHSHMHIALNNFQVIEKIKIEAKRKSILTIDGKTVVADLKGKSKSFDAFWEDADISVINDLYRRASRIFSPDIARTYVNVFASKTADPKNNEEFEEALMEGRTLVAALGLVSEVETYFDKEADSLTKEWFLKYKLEIKALSHDRQEAYRQINEMSTEPQGVELIKPEARFELTKVRNNGIETPLRTYSKHLLCDENNKFPAELNTWEIQVVETEMKKDGFCFWYRNPQQPGQSSLGISYIFGERNEIMRPDFLFFSMQEDELVSVDIVDPHGIHLADALPKLKGLAKYAEVQGHFYRRIESIAEALGKLRFLDLKNEKVRKAIVESDDILSLFSGSFALDY